MARPLRIEYPGAVYHVTSRENEKKPVFKDDADREIVLTAGWRVRTDLLSSSLARTGDALILGNVCRGRVG